MSLSATEEAVSTAKQIMTAVLTEDKDAFFVLTDGMSEQDQYLVRALAELSAGFIIKASENMEMDHVDFWRTLLLKNMTN